MNNLQLKKIFEKKLIRRGMLKTTDGQVLVPPNRQFNTLGEEILWMINEAKFKLSVNELATYLDKDTKIINKVMRKLTATNVDLVKKQKQGSQFVYSANFSEDIHIPTIYKLVRMNTTARIR